MNNGKLTVKLWIPWRYDTRGATHEGY